MSSVLDVMSMIRGGTALEYANRELRAVIMAVKATGLKGKITITINVIPDKNDETVVKFKPKVVPMIPMKEFAEGYAFVAPNGDVSREDPRQHELELERQEKLAEQGATALTRVGRG
jgi:hypothetical protein